MWSWHQYKLECMLSRSEVYSFRASFMGTSEHLSTVIGHCWMVHEGAIQEEGRFGSMHESSSKSRELTLDTLWGNHGALTHNESTSDLVMLHLFSIVHSSPSNLIDTACWHPQCLARHTTHGCDPHSCKQWLSFIYSHFNFQFDLLLSNLFALVPSSISFLMQINDCDQQVMLYCVTLFFLKSMQLFF
jgi:hypothetical protein